MQELIEKMLPEFRLVTNKMSTVTVEGANRCLCALHHEKSGLSLNFYCEIVPHKTDPDIKVVLEQLFKLIIDFNQFSTFLNWIKKRTSEGVKFRDLLEANLVYQYDLNLYETLKKMLGTDLFIEILKHTQYSRLSLSDNF